MTIDNIEICSSKMVFDSMLYEDHYFRFNFPEGFICTNLAGQFIRVYM